MQAVRNPKPIQHPDTFGPWSKGNQCQIEELNGIWVIDSINIFDFQGPYEFEQINCTKLKKDGTRSKYTATVRADKLIELGAKQPTTDKDGLTAEQCAKQIFNDGYAKHGYYNTDRESLVKVMNITKSGRVAVQHMSIKRGITARSKTVDSHKIYDQEHSLVNFAELEYELRGEAETFTPRLHDRKWTWWRESSVIEQPTMKMTWLND